MAALRPRRRGSSRHPVRAALSDDFPSEVWTRLDLTVSAINMLDLYASNAPLMISRSARQIDRLPNLAQRRLHMEEATRDHEADDKMARRQQHFGH